MSTAGAPAVSIVTPMYNSKYIGATIDSVLAQTHADWELLAVDDCSRDGTADIVAEYERGDPRVRLLRHRQNAGPAAARNTALEAARGRYIAFLDSDDLWLPSKLERQMALMQGGGVPMSYTPYRRITETGELSSPLIEVPDRMDYRAALRQTAMMTSTVVVDRERTGPFRMRPLYYDDYACWLDLLRRGITAVAVQEDLMRYRVVQGSVSRNKLKSAYKVFEVQRTVGQLPLPKALYCFAGYAFHAFRKYYLTR